MGYKVFTSWEDQTALQCLKQHRITFFRFLWGKSALYLTGFFWERKTESFREAASKETCFSLYLREGKFFIQLYWLLRFTVVAKFCRISVTIKLNSNQQKNNNKMCFFVDCSRLTPGARGEHLTSQLSRVAASTFIKRVCPVHLVDIFDWTALKKSTGTGQLIVTALIQAVKLLSTGGHKITVLIWSDGLSKVLSALDVYEVFRKKYKRAIFVLKF